MKHFGRHQSQALSCRDAACVALLVAALAADTAASIDTQLVVFGDTSPGGLITLEFHGQPGAPLLLAAGLGIAEPPLMVKGQPFYIDTSLPWFVIPLGVLPASGQQLLPAALPGDAVLLGAQIHMQSAAPTLGNATSMRVHAPGAVVSPAGAGANFGGQILTYDLNGDGLGDTIIAAPSVTGGGPGEVWIAYGPSTQPSLVIDDPTPQPAALFGAALAAGNLVGGPEPDLVISATAAGTFAADWTGEAWILQGPDFTVSKVLKSPDPASGAVFGTQLEVGDFDGDGLDDVAASEFAATVAGQSQAGAVHIFRGPAFTHWLTLTKPGTEPLKGALFGAALAAGDIDGDGIDDLVVGAPNATLQNQPQVGEAWVFYGPFTGTPVLLRDVLPSAGSAFACRVALGSVMGDARLDVIVGIPGGQGSPPFELGPGIRVGEVQVFDGADPMKATVFDDPTPEDFGHFGFEVGSADVNGDGAQDLLIGANLADLGGIVNAGELFVYLGPSFGARFEISEPVPEASVQFSTFFGSTDINGDGKDELVVGYPAHSPGGLVAAGSVLVVDF